MMKKSYCTRILLLFGMCAKMEANPTITFFFEPYHDINALHQKIKKPGKLAQHSVHAIVNHTPIAGILVTYSGYVATSSYNGEITFPRKHQKPVITILITPEMKPIPLFENTILHWTLLPDMPAQMYSCEQKHDEVTGKSYWVTQEIPLPADNIIPLSTMVIIADPKNIVMNTERVAARETANLVLPEIGVKKGIDIIENSSYMLTIRHLFRPIQTEEKPEPFKMLTHIVE
ncbi:MAG TPA: hypothetical protein VKU36_06115 [Candidatus Babeliales bacterium]|nr:hypothetical protein [Candidatus Babeliales bacterium]